MVASKVLENIKGKKVAEQNVPSPIPEPSPYEKRNIVAEHQGVLQPTAESPPPEKRRRYHLEGNFPQFYRKVVDNIKVNNSTNMKKF